MSEKLPIENSPENSAEKTPRYIFLEKQGSKAIRRYLYRQPMKVVAVKCGDEILVKFLPEYETHSSSVAALYSQGVISESTKVDWAGGALIKFDKRTNTCEVFGSSSSLNRGIDEEATKAIEKFLLTREMCEWVGSREEWGQEMIPRGRVSLISLIV